MYRTKFNSFAEHAARTARFRLAKFVSEAGESRDRSRNGKVNGSHDRGSSWPEVGRLYTSTARCSMSSQQLESASPKVRSPSPWMSPPASLSSTGFVIEPSASLLVSISANHKTPWTAKGDEEVVGPGPASTDWKNRLKVLVHFVVVVETWKSFRFPR